MANAASVTVPATPEGSMRLRWGVALASTSLVVTVGLVVAIQQFVLKFLWDQSAHTRTVGGVLYLLLGVVGIGLPILLYRKRRQFLALSPTRQWLLALLVPVAYVLAFALCMECPMRSTFLVVPRPFTSTAVVQISSDKSGVEFRGGWRPDLESGRNDARNQDGVEQFSSHLYQSFLRHPRRETVTIVGRTERLNDGTVQVTLDVDATEPVRFSAENLESVQITRDHQPIAESNARSGNYEVIITGRLKNRHLEE